jgi:26S proteasome regulatory subunit N2
MLQDFKFPKNFEIVCNSKPSAFAYPKKLEEKKEEKKKRVETVALSTTAKEKARQARKRAKEGGTGMEVEKEEAKKEETKEKKDDDMGEKMEVEKEEEEQKKVKKKREPEPTSFRVSNPARITTAQSVVCEFDLGQRYRPIRPEEKPFGVIILTDSTPGETEDLGAVKAPSLEPEGECAPPEPFEWMPPGHTEAEAAPKEESTSKESEESMSS